MKRFCHRNYELEDLYQIGCIGFIKAVQQFDLTKENQLSTYATYCVLGEIKRFLRDNGPIKVSRRLKEIAQKVRALQEDSIRENGIELTIDEMSQKLAIEKEEIIFALEASLPLESIDRKVGENASQTIVEKIASPEKGYEQVLNQMVLQKALLRLEAKEKKIIFLRYFREMRQSVIAESLGISQVQVSRIEKRALQKMQCHIFRF